MSKKILKGKVISNKMQKTVVVAVEKTRRHPLYEKVIRATKKYKAHSEIQIPEGTEVTIEQTRPLSAQKRWIVVSPKEENEKGGKK